MTIKPLADRVLVEPKEAETKTYFDFIYISTYCNSGLRYQALIPSPQLSKAADDFCSIEKGNLQVSVAKHNTRRYIEMHNYYINILSHLKGIYL